MKIFPAIDIKDNRCVRLRQGDFDQVEVYGGDPVNYAEKWKREGASYLHLVDLNGANDEGFVNQEAIEKIVKKIGLPVQVGGGIRSKKRVQELLDLGVDRVILGTVAVEEKDLLLELVQEYGEKIVVSIDAKNGMAATRGWKQVSTADALKLCQELKQIGVNTIVYTDISRDGMLTGPNFSAYENILKSLKINLIASGGISTLGDIKKLREIGVYGAIIGKALYEKRLNLREVILCSQEESSPAWMCEMGK